MNINTDYFKTFYYVAKNKSISKAAQELYISQPAISKAIKKLETETGCILFIRTPKGVRLTAEGELLFIDVQKAFNHLKNVESIIDNIARKETGQVTIGISNTLCKYFFLPRLEKYHKAYPKIQVKIINVPSPKTLALLQKSEIDFGIISIDRNNENFDYIPLMELHDVFVASQKDNWDQVIPIEKLVDYPVMMLEKGNQTRFFIERFLSSHGVVLEPDIEIGSMDFLIEFARIGIGIACVIREFIEQELKENSLYELNISPKPLVREMGIVTRKNISLTQASQSFIDFILAQQ